MTDLFDQIEYLFHKGYFFKGYNHCREIYARKGSLNAPIHLVYEYEKAKDHEKKQYEVTEG